MYTLLLSCGSVKIKLDIMVVKEHNDSKTVAMWKTQLIWLSWSKN